MNNESKKFLKDFLSQCGLDIPAILEVTARKWESEKGSIILLAGWDGWVRGVLRFITTNN